MKDLQEHYNKLSQLYEISAEIYNIMVLDQLILQNTDIFAPNLCWDVSTMNDGIYVVGYVFVICEGIPT